MKQIANILFGVTLFLFINCGQGKVKTPENAIKEFRCKEKFTSDEKLFYPEVGDETQKPTLIEKINLATDNFEKLAKTGNVTDKDYQIAETRVLELVIKRGTDDTDYPDKQQPQPGVYQQVNTQQNADEQHDISVNQHRFRFKYAENDKADGAGFFQFIHTAHVIVVFADKVSRSVKDNGSDNRQYSERPVHIGYRAGFVHVEHVRKSYQRRRTRRGPRPRMGNHYPVFKFGHIFFRLKNKEQRIKTLQSLCSIIYPIDS